VTQGLDTTGALRGVEGGVVLNTPVNRSRFWRDDDALAIDTGNTHTVLGLFEGEALRELAGRHAQVHRR
jgi:hypothetical protein